MPSSFTGLETGVTFAENTVNETPQIIDAAISYGTTGSLSGGTLVVSGLLAEDIVSILSEGFINYDSGTGVIRYMGVIIGTATGGVGGDFTVTFNASANYSMVDQLIEHLTYANTSDAPTATRTLTVNVTDSTGDLTGVRYTSLTGAANPFDGLGGGAALRPALGDADGDGDLDLVVGSYSGGLSYYENTGTASSPSYVQQTGANNPFNGVDVGFTSAPEWVDIDGDSDLDLVVGDQDGVLHYFENTGAGFTERTGEDSPFDGIDAGARATPDLADLDGDGDLDMVLGSMTGPFHYYENTGTATGAEWTERTDAANPFNDFGYGSNSVLRLADFDADGDVDAMVLGLGSMVYLRNTGTAAAPVYEEIYDSTSPVIGLGALDFYGVDLVNLDGDSDLEFVGGDVPGALYYIDKVPYSAPSIVVTVTAEDEPPGGLEDVASPGAFAENTVNTTPQLLDADVTFVDRGEGFNGGSLTVSGLLAEDLVSIRSNGAISYNSGTGDVSYNGTVIGNASGGVGAALTVTFNADADEAAIEALIEHLQYANSSDAPTASRTLSISIVDEAGTSVGYARVTGTGNPFDGITGARISPELADMDDDGDLDLAFGSSGTGIRYFENTGSATAPTYVERTALDNPFNGVSIAAGVGAPELADLDGDGDLDLVVGDYSGTVTYFENVGTASAASYVQRTGGDNPFAGVDADFTGSPALADLDGDGDLDLAFGSADGALRYFENTGSASAAAYNERTGAANPFAGFASAGPVAPALGDFDGDGDIDLVVGDWDGTLRYFENVGTAAAPVYLPASPNPVAGIVGGSMLATPGVADVDGDGKLDIVFGVLTGALSYVRNTSVTITVQVNAEVDVFTGAGGDDTFGGTAGDDYIDGGDGTDSLTGADGDDYLKGGDGADVLSGGLGDDTYVVDQLGDTVDETGGGGTDLVWSRVSWTLAAGFENLTLGTAAGASDGTGNDVDNIITGNASANALTGLEGNDTLLGLGGHDVLSGGDGQDQLDGSTGNDTLSGGDGDDSLTGGAGNDRLDGGVGKDSASGGLGNDTYVISEADDTITEAGGGGTDTVESAVSWNLAADFEHLTLIGVGDVTGTGNALRNTITGNTGDNVLGGGGEVDTLSGGDGADTLYGNEANDVLNGGDGNDILEGDTGGDRLTGGQGADRFRFVDDDLAATAVERDQVTDLTFGDGDILDLAGIDANTTLGGDQAFVWAAKFTKVAGQAVLKLASGVTTLELDVDGDGKADFRIAISGDHTSSTGNLYTGAGDTDGGWVL